MASSDPSSAVSSSVSAVSPTLFVATLSLRRVTREHRGNYSCSPSNAKAARVRLHVIDGERIVEEVDRLILAVICSVMCARVG